MSDVDLWRRRERSLAAGIVIWSIGISVLAALKPEELVEYILSTEPLLLAGSNMISIGLSGGLSLTLFEIAARWSEPGDDLTDWEGDDP